MEAVVPSSSSFDVASLGFTPGQIVQEYGWDDDVDDALRIAIEKIVGSELVDEDYGAVSDGVIAWCRDDEEDDLTDLLVDLQTVLTPGGLIWLFTPKTGRPGHIPQGDIVEAAATAGLHATSTYPVADAWSATKLVSSGRSR